MLYLQNVVSRSALTAGLVPAPMSVLLLVLSPVFGRLSGKHGARPFMTVGPLLCAAGLLLFTWVGPSAGFWTDVLLATIVFGLGMAATVAPLTGTVMLAVSHEYCGIAATVNNVASRVAGLLAVAGLGVVISLSFRATVATSTDDLSLRPSVTDAIEELAAEPTGALDVAELPPQVEEVIRLSYTVAFRRAMIVSAAVAAAGGGLAALMIRDQKSRWS